MAENEAPGWRCGAPSTGRPVARVESGGPGRVRALLVRPQQLLTEVVL